MSYRMNIGKELSQIKYCKTIDEVIAFLKDHNLKFGHYYLGSNFYTNDDTSHPLTYIVANYWDDNNDVWINFVFSLKRIEAIN